MKDKKILELEKKFNEMQKNFHVNIVYFKNTILIGYY